MLLTYNTFSNPGTGVVQTTGGASGSVDGSGTFGVGGTTGMDSQGGPASAEPAPKLALAATTLFTGPTGTTFSYNAGAGSALVNANLILDSQNASAQITVTSITPSTTQNGITAPNLTGANPVGTAFNFTGTPAASGTTTFTVTLNDGTLSKVWTVTFNVATTVAPQITSTAPTTANVGSLYSYTIVATGTPAPTLSVTGNPAWLTLTGNVLSGTPSAVGTVGPITITAANGVNPNATQQFSITVNPALTAPQITSTAPTTGTVGTLYTYNITTTGYPAVTLSVSGNPAWLTLTGSTLSGTPTAVGTFGPITITASNGVNPNATQQFSINVGPAQVAPQITSTAPTAGVVGTLYTYNITATGVPTPTLSVAGNPAWLTLTGSTLSGTPTAAGVFGPITITATNGVNPNATQNFSITVTPAPVAPQITSTAVTSGQAGVLYTYNITATGSPTPTLSVSGNPAWLTLSGNTLSGTPTTAGVVGPITITATNGVNPPDTQVFSINVATLGTTGGGGGGGGGCSSDTTKGLWLALMVLPLAALFLRKRRGMA